MGLYEQTEQFNKETSLIHIDFEGTDMTAKVQHVKGQQLLAAILHLTDLVIEANENVGVELASMITARAITGGK